MVYDKNWKHKSTNFGLDIWTCRTCSDYKGRRKLKTETYMPSRGDMYRHYVDEHGNTLCGCHKYNTPNT